jgi:hypothetical protein
MRTRWETILAVGVLCGALVFGGTVEAAPIAGSAGTATFTDGPNSEGLTFTIKVDFEAFDGLEASDPLGVTPGETQYAFILEYLDGNENMSRFDVESTFGISLGTTGTSTAGIVNGVSPGDAAPVGHGIITLASGRDGARFLYSAGGEALFGPAGAKSVILVYTAPVWIDAGLVTAGVTNSSLSDAAEVAGPVPLGDEGCTPGYWKNHAGQKPNQPNMWPSAYSVDDDFDTTFGVDLFDPDITLLEALRRKGGNVNALARHATAALLSSAAPIDYKLYAYEVIQMVQDAAGPDGDIEVTKEELESFNDRDCPL